MSTCLNKYDMLNYIIMLDINKLLELIILDRNPNTNILSNSSNDTNIQIHKHLIGAIAPR